MSFDLKRFDSGDTDYLAKLNANAALLEQAIRGLQVGAGNSGSPQNVAAAFSALFPANTDATVGPDAWQTSATSGGVRVAPGFAWVASLRRVGDVQSATTINMQGQNSGTYYVTIDASGAPIATSATGAGRIYRFSWDADASAASDITRLAAITWGADQWLGAQESAALGQTFETLDARLEAGEAATQDLVIKHNMNADAPPTSGNDGAEGYSMRSLWFVPDTAELFIAIAMSSSEGEWLSLTSGGTLAQLGDVDTSSADDGYELRYSASQGKWVATAPDAQADPDARQFWRLLVNGAVVDRLYFYEIQFRTQVGVAEDSAPAGATLADGFITPENAFDGDTGTNANANDPDAGAYLGFNYGTPKRVRQVWFKGGAYNEGNGPPEIIVQASDDGVTWTDVDTIDASGQQLNTATGAYTIQAPPSGDVASVEEAPIDGSGYERKDGTWEKSPWQKVGGGVNTDVPASAGGLTSHATGNAAVLRCNRTDGSIGVMVSGSGGSAFCYEDSAYFRIGRTTRAVMEGTSFSYESVLEADSSGRVFLTGTFRPGAYTVSTLPSSPGEGFQAFATDGQNAAGGIGVPVYYSGGWKVFGTDQPVST